jgi:hypothetical protein
MKQASDARVVAHQKIVADLRKDGSLQACEPDVTRQGELRTTASSSTAHGCDGRRRQARHRSSDWLNKQ